MRNPFEVKPIWNCTTNVSSFVSCSIVYSSMLTCLWREYSWVNISGAKSTNLSTQPIEAMDVTSSTYKGCTSSSVSRHTCTSTHLMCSSCWSCRIYAATIGLKLRPFCECPPWRCIDPSKLELQPSAQYLHWLYLYNPNMDHTMWA